MALRIDYEADGFPAGGPIANGSGTLHTSWDEVLWAAVTVGRPNRQYVFSHGLASTFEALFRWSLVRMALEQSGPTATRLRRTSAARTLDPTEKGATSYFLGLAICKLFAAKLLDAPWLLHLDVFRPLLNPVLTGRSRPDLVGQTANGSWVALECKGRVSPPDEPAKEKAKEQAQRLIVVNGAVPAFQIGAIAYLRNEILHFFWRDPAADPLRVKRPIKVNVEADAWRLYYAPLIDLIRSGDGYFERMQREPVLMPVESADIELGIHPAVLRLIVASNWAEIRGRGWFSTGQIAPGGPFQADGVAVVAGQSWQQPFKEARQ